MEELHRMVERGRAYNADQTLGRSEFSEGAVFSEDAIGAVIGRGCYGMAVLGAHLRQAGCMHNRHWRWCPATFRRRRLPSPAKLCHSPSPSRP